MLGWLVDQGDVSALVDISVQVRRGNFVFLTGASGAGKSTLLKLIISQEQPTSGQILVNGINLNRVKRSQIPFFRRQIGVVFQDFRLLPNRTVFDNVALALEVSSVPTREIARRVRYAARQVGLETKLNSRPIRLSGGEQQRVAIARAIVNTPVLLLADEPTGNLDPEMSLEIMNLFSDINAEGTTVMVATHDKTLIDHFSREVITLNRGRII